MTRAVTYYAIIRVETGDAYVGSTVSCRQRWAAHRHQLNKGAHHCPRLQRAWSKYSAEAFLFRVLAESAPATAAERTATELDWIERLGVYNVLIKGKFGQLSVSPEQCQARAAAAKLKLASDPQHAERLAQRGKAIAALAKTPAAREAMGEFTKRRWTDPEERQRLSAGHRNRWAAPGAHEAHSAKARQKMQDAARAAAHSAMMRAKWADPNGGFRNRRKVGRGPNKA